MKVAIIGCGQLARMMALKGWPMNIRFSFLAEAGESDRPVAGLGNVVVREPNDTAATLYDKLDRPDVITVEREQIDADLLRALQSLCPVYPDPEIIATTQHRLREKQALQKLGLPVADFMPVNNRSELEAAATALGYPFFVKSCEQGYDGKNQWYVTESSMLDTVAQATAAMACVAEAAINFDVEASVIGARSASGSIVVYPLAENRHQQGVLVNSVVPAQTLSPAIGQLAGDYLNRLMTEWNYVGVLAIELFVSGDSLLINELAPRVHNSGHWSMNGSETCQFENHIRAILDFPPGSTGVKGHCAMVNLLGKDVSPEQLLSANSYVHLYNKSLKPGRKMGHVNILCDRQDDLKRQLADLMEQLYP